MLENLQMQKAKNLLAVYQLQTTNGKYRVTFENGLIENEIDYVFVGKSNKNPTVNKDEVSDFEWIDIEKLKQKMDLYPDLYTFWLKEIIKKYKLKNN